MVKTKEEHPTFNVQHRTPNTIKRRIHFALLGVPVLALVILLGAMVWAKSRDPFERIEFKLKTAHHGSVQGIVVLPKPIHAYPVVVYLYGADGSVLTSGNSLRQMAELGMAAVAIEYNKTNREAFDEQFHALLDFIPRQSWARSNAIAWVGLSRGAQCSLQYLLKHPEVQPQLLVRVSGGWVPELEEAKKVESVELRVESSKSQPLFRCPVLLVHGEKDEIFPVEDARRLAALLMTNGVSVTSKIFPGKGHGYDTDRSLVIRTVGEYCKAVLAPGEPFSGLAERRTIPFWVCMLPAGVWLLIGIYVKRKSSAGEVKEARAPLTKVEVGLRWVAGVLALLAIADTALHLVPPRMEVSRGTLELARKYLVPPKEKNEFEFLAEKPVWDGRKLKVLLEHVELASYNRQLINWKLEEPVYRDYVLCPTIDSLPREELNWRRPLWESFYPRIRKQDTPTDAAVIVVRFLRERVTIDLKRKWDGGVETIWKRGITDESGFEKIYVAALRSVGVGARLDSEGKAEFWTGEVWKAAPRPLVSSLLAAK